MISLDAITFHYKATQIFKDFSWEVADKESWAVLGPSGCGKSTLLALIAGIRFPNSGQVLIDDVAIRRPRPQTGLILQDYGLLPWATVYQNASLGFDIRNFYGADGIHAPKTPDINSRVPFWLGRLGLREVANKFPSQLSGGQRQRTAIARTLALNPNLLLMDEPFSSLDAPTRESLQQLILELVGEQNLTFVIVTHSIEEAVLLGKKILLLNHPPNKLPQIITNPRAGSLDYRESEEYQVLCRDLRVRMDARGDLEQ